MAKVVRERDREIDRARNFLQQLLMNSPNKPNIAAFGRIASVAAVHVHVVSKSNHSK